MSVHVYTQGTFGPRYNVLFHLGGLCLRFKEIKFTTATKRRKEKAIPLFPQQSFQRKKKIYDNLTLCLEAANVTLISVISQRHFHLDELS